MEQLIRSGVDPNSWDCDEKRNSVLHWAVSFGNAKTVAYLIGKELGKIIHNYSRFVFLEKGNDVNTETNEGVTPLHDAVEREDLEIISLLLKNNASPLIKAEKGYYKIINILAILLN
jgi:ankyrin repeat protein